MKDRTILITGGAGCFGRAFVAYALAQGARRVIVYSRDEEKHRRLQADFPDPRLDCFIGDIRDRDKLRRAMQADGLNVVVHAAALKMIDRCEAAPDEAIKTNIQGSQNVIDAALDVGVPKVLGVSTDKACDPINVYGATKLVMERLFVSANRLAGSKPTRFACVRYGNVIGSTGSILQVWRAQRADGRPLSVTHRDMTRFFFSVSASVDFVADALAGMQGGEVFIPKLSACSIGDLADAVSDQQQIVGLRRGEKMHESLISERETANAYDAGWCYLMVPGLSLRDQLTPVLAELRSDTAPRVDPAVVLSYV